MISRLSHLVLFLVMATLCVEAFGQGLLIPGKKSKLKTSIETTTEVTLKAPDQSHKCEVDMELEYQQRDDKAQVTTYSTVPGCGAAEGPYRLFLTYVDSENKTQTVQHDEHWSLQNDGIATKEYDLAENVQLTRVYLRRVRCECVDPKNDSESGTE